MQLPLPSIVLVALRWMPLIADLSNVGHTMRCTGNAAERALEAAAMAVALMSSGTHLPALMVGAIRINSTNQPEPLQKPPTHRVGSWLWLSNIEV